MEVARSYAASLAGDVPVLADLLDGLLDGQGHAGSPASTEEALAAR
jgi:hypothetical protein